MVIQGEVGGKFIEIEVTESAKQIIDNKQKDLYYIYKNNNLHTVLEDVKKNKIDTMVSVHIADGVQYQTYHHLLKRKTTLFESLEELFNEKEWYEVNSLLKDYYNNNF